MASESATPPPRRRLLRVGFPCIVLVLGALGTTALWAWPGENLERAARVSGTWLITGVAIIGLLIWVVAFSGFLWAVRLAVLFAFLAVAGSVDSIERDGDLSPTGLHFRWQRSPTDALEARLHSQPKAALPAAPRLAVTTADDFPEYRGRARDGVVTAVPLGRDWSAQPPRIVWRQPAGGGFAGFAVVGDNAFTIEQRHDNEAIVCYDTNTGGERWVETYPARFHETLGGEGPRATPTLAGGDLFSLGATGRLTCLDAPTGQRKWSVNILADNENIMWGMSGSPLVVDDLVIVHPGTQTAAVAGRSVIALDRTTGKEVWATGDARASYSSPMVATLAGQRQLLLLDANGLAGYEIKTGKELWRYPWKTYQDINVAQPVVLGNNRVFVSSGYGVGCAMVEVSVAAGKWSVQQLWRNKAMRCKFGSPVEYHGSLYGLDDGILVCVDAATGERKWKDGRYGHGQLLRSGDLLLILAESGKLVLVEATPEGHHELGSLPVLDGKTWNSFALVGNRAFVRNHLEMACVELPRP